MKLNLGCGPDKRSGYVNADILESADMVVDLSTFPWPWENDSVDEVLMMHVLEHLPDTYRTMAEIRRILKPGGVFRGQVPHAFSYAGMMHPQHYRHFTDQSFLQLAKDFKMDLLVAKNINLPCPNWKFRLRNLLPFKNIMQGIILNVYDAVDFELRKP